MKPIDYLEVASVTGLWSVIEYFRSGNKIPTTPEWAILLSVSLTFVILSGILWGFTKLTTKPKRKR